MNHESRVTLRVRGLKVRIMNHESRITLRVRGLKVRGDFVAGAALCEPEAQISWQGAALG